MGHSTESALLRVQNDILCFADDSMNVILLMLDLSVAFNSVDYQILLSRLHDCYGIYGAAYRWITSYLADRTPFVSIEGVTSVVLVELPRALAKLLYDMCLLLLNTCCLMKTARKTLHGVRSGIHLKKK